MEYKEGDYIIQQSDCSGAVAGKIYRLERGFIGLTANPGHPSGGCACQYKWKPYQNNTIINYLMKI